jgi:hypothetical protein
MEQEVREIIDMHVGDKLSVMKQMEESWSRQTMRPTAEEVDAWLKEGRP